MEDIAEKKSCCSSSWCNKDVEAKEDKIEYVDTIILSRNQLRHNYEVFKKLFAGICGASILLQLPFVPRICSFEVGECWCPKLILSTTLIT